MQEANDCINGSPRVKEMYNTRVKYRINQGMIAKANTNLIYSLFLKSKDGCRIAFDLPIQTRLTDWGLNPGRRLSLPNRSQYRL